MPPIETSVFELFRIGPGPSSSHTIGPMRAAARFLAELERLDASQRNEAVQAKIHLYGSLSATGQGHGTVEAVLAGLLGHEPETAPPDILEQLRTHPAQHRLALGDRELPLSAGDVIFDTLDHPFP